MKTKRWLFITTLEAQWGGSELLWTETALELRRRGASAGFVLPWPKTGAQVDELRRAGLASFSEIPEPARWWRRMWRRKCSLRERRRRILQEWSPNFVILSQSRQDAGTGWAEVLAAARAPYAVLNHVVADDIWLSEAAAESLVFPVRRGPSGLLCFRAQPGRPHGAAGGPGAALQGRPQSFRHSPSTSASHGPGGEMS